MSLTGAVSNALSGLLSNQEQMRVISGNVSNAGVEGFTRKVAPQETRVIGLSTNGGVRNQEVQRDVDEFLVERLRQSETTLNFDQTKSEFFQRVQDFFGSPSSDANLSNKINSLRQEIENLALEPENSAAQNSLVQEAVNLARDLNNFSREAQNLRAEADVQIDIAVEELNGNLKEIRDLNAQISQAKAAGRSTANLEDRRDVALKEVSKTIDIQTFQRPTGEVAVLSGDSNARPLVDGFAEKFSFDSAGSLGSGAQAGAVTFTDGTALDADTIGGRLGALLQVRDQDLPNFQADLDRLAAQLREQVNEAHNTGMLNNDVATATGGLTGTHRFDPTAQTIAGASGTLDIVAVDSNGRVQTDANGNPRVISVDLSAAASASNGQIGDGADFANGVPAGAGGPATDFLDQLNQRINDQVDILDDGVDNDNAGLDQTGGSTDGFRVTDPNGDGFAQVTLSNPFGNGSDFVIRTNGARVESNQINAQNTDPANNDTPDRNFSHFFGFNNFFETPDPQAGFPNSNPDMITGNLELPGGANASADTSSGVSAAGTLRVRQDIVDDPTKLSRAEAKTGGGETALPNGDPLVSQNMAQRFDDVVEFRDPGDLRSTVQLRSGTGIPDQVGGLDGATRPLSAGGVTTGATDLEVTDGTNTLTLTGLDAGTTTLSQIASQINANPNFNAGVSKQNGSAFLDIRSTNGSTISVSSPSAPPDLANELAFGTPTTPSDQTTGNVGGRTVTLANFAGDILQFQAQETTRLNTSVEAQNGVKDQLQLRVDNQSGVNIDEELANIIQFQQAFQANARVVSVVDELFTTLDRMAR